VGDDKNFLNELQDFRLQPVPFAMKVVRLKFLMQSAFNGTAADHLQPLVVADLYVGQPRTRFFGVADLDTATAPQIGPSSFDPVSPALRAS